ncbi:MAG: hypothetical protein SOZ66_05460, partial [Candidatus Cryptobacteroides sp.]|nr:hypothetical protein [Candidatus Cryptobacteroides sp.]
MDISMDITPSLGMGALEEPSAEAKPDSSINETIERISEPTITARTIFQKDFIVIRIAIPAKLRKIPRIIVRREEYASEGILEGVGSEGEFHRSARLAFEALLAGVAWSREIHLVNRCASEGILKGVAPKGEFHETAQSAFEALLAGVASTGEIHLVKRCASEGLLMGV